MNGEVVLFSIIGMCRKEIILVMSLLLSISLDVDFVGVALGFLKCIHNCTQTATSQIPRGIRLQTTKSDQIRPTCEPFFMTSMTGRPSMIFSM